MSEFNITHFPTEILEKIFFHFDDITNSIVSGVCKRFNEVVDRTVCRKYNGSNRNRWYEIEIFGSSMDSQEIVQHCPFIVMRVKALNLTFHVDLSNPNHWIHRVINRIGRNIRMIRLRTPNYNDHISVNFHSILSKMPNISHLYVKCVYPTNRKWCYQRYMKLTDLDLNLRTMFDANELKPLVKNNSQLRNVKLDVFDFRLLYAFNQTKIKSLSLRFSHVTGKDVSVDIQPIRMAHLKKLELAVPKNLFDECVERIVAPCRDLQDLRLVYFEDFALTDETVDHLCSLRSLETFEACFYMPLGDYVRFIDRMPTLVTFALWHKMFTFADYQVLLKAANKHPRLRFIRFQENTSDIFNHSILKWLMENVNNRIQMEHFVCYKLVISAGKVQYDGVTIMTSNGSPSIGNGKVFNEWLERLQFTTSIDDQYYEFFSNLPMLRDRFDESKNTHLHLRDEVDEAFVKRRGPYVIWAYSTFSSSYDRSVDGINWLERHCHRLRELTIRFEYDHPQLPIWTFPELNVLRINYGRKNHHLDLSLFESFECPQLKCLKFVGQHPISLTNIQIVHDINLFDNLVTLEMFHFNEWSNNLLETFNRNVKCNIRELTLANRRIDFERFKMNNRTIIAISEYPNLTHLKLILAGLNETNTKFLFGNCTKLSELYFECNFLSNDDFGSSSSRIFEHIKSNCIALKRLQLVWHDAMMDPYKVNGIKSTFPNVFVKIMQIDDHMNTKAEQIIYERDDGLERLFNEFEV